VRLKCDQTGLTCVTVRGTTLQLANRSYKAIEIARNTDEEIMLNRITKKLGLKGW